MASRLKLGSAWEKGPPGTAPSSLCQVSFLDLGWLPDLWRQIHVSLCMCLITSPIYFCCRYGGVRCQIGYCLTAPARRLKGS